MNGETEKAIERVHVILVKRFEADQFTAQQILNKYLTASDSPFPEPLFSRERSEQIKANLRFMAERAVCESQVIDLVESALKQFD